VVFFKPELAEGFDYRRKRAGQLVSKGRLFGAQFSAWLQDDHWLDLAHQANHAAQVLAVSLQAHAGIRLAWPVQANEVFVVMPKALLERLLAAGAECYDWYPDSLPTSMPLGADEVPVRFVTAWSTSQQQLDEFAEVLGS
jgi:threonine aldolase